MCYALLSFKMISFVLFRQALQPSMNLSISELICYTRHMGTVLTCIENYTWHVPSLTRKKNVGLHDLSATHYRDAWGKGVFNMALSYCWPNFKFSLWYTKFYIFKSIWKNLHFFTNTFSFIPGVPFTVVNLLQIFEELPGSFSGKARFFTRQVCILLTTLI